MKRFFHLGLIGLAATATLMMAPLTLTAANAQEYPLLQELELSDDQKEAVQDIFQDLRGDLDDILTDDQQDQFWTVYRELQDVQAAALAIDNLTDSQKDDLREALQDTRADLSEVLTDEQLAELREIRQTRRHNRRR
jgi:Spy/CpxP family protein refolding chaperone